MTASKPEAAPNPGSDLATTPNPMGIIVPPSVQWPEARSFTRIYDRNPNAQARLLQTLVGAYNILFDGWVPNPEHPMTHNEKKQAQMCLAGTIKWLSEQFPEWSLESSGDEGFGDYTRDDRLPPLLGAVIEDYEELADTNEHTN